MVLRTSTIASPRAAAVFRAFLETASQMRSAALDISRAADRREVKD
jgi:hypothetical protein